MLREFLSSTFSLSIQDFLRGTNIRNHISSLNKTDLLELDQLERIQLAKLKKLLILSNQRFPFYNKLFNEHKLKPDNLSSLNDFKIFPIIDKEIVRSAGDDLYLSDVKKPHVKYGKTGGTTGMPLFYKKDANTRSVGWGAYYRWYQSIGLKKSMAKVSLWGAPTVTSYSRFRRFKDFCTNYLSNTLVINSFNINEKTLPHIVHKIKRWKPKVLHGYLSALIQLAYYIEENGIDGIEPRAILPTTETLLPPYRELLERVFKGKVHDQYGCGECGSIGFECSIQNGLHIAMEHCILEIINPNNEGIGDIVVTDLDNFEMPFIRYKNGDKGMISYDVCRCGRNSPRILKIYGRNTDTITLKDGSKVHGVFFTDIFGEFNFVENKNIKRFQVYQVKKDSIELKIEGQELDKANEQKLVKVLKLYFDDFNISYHEHLDSDSSGKFRYVVSEL